MKRAVICTSNPQDYIPQLKEYSIMIVDPNCQIDRYNYLLEKSDWSLLITDKEEKYRDGNDYPNERILLYTSGTTGDSKFYGFTQEQIEIAIKNNISAYNITNNDRYASVMPLWHAHGQSFYWTTQYAKCDVQYFPPTQLRSVVKYAPTFSTSVPHILKLLKNFNFNKLRFLASAGSPMSVELYHALKNKFQIPILEAFGMTETISHCFTNPLYGEQRVGTIGLPNGIEARIEDQCLYIRGPSLSNAGWIDTGDLADQDEKGYYRILGRGVDQINVKGVKLNPASLELQLKNKVLNLDNCVIFGVDTVNCIFTGSAIQNQIQEFLLSLGPYCKAKHIIKLDEIPLTSSGKISRIFLNNLLMQEKLK